MSFFKDRPTIRKHDLYSSLSMSIRQWITTLSFIDMKTTTNISTTSVQYVYAKG
jgi:hypothetical protein